jgi:hypothetical protein
MGWDISGRIGVTDTRCTWSGTSMDLVWLSPRVGWWTLLSFRNFLYYLESVSCFISMLPFFVFMKLV